jgi:ribonuclease J
VEPLIICLVQPAPGGTPAYKGRSDAEPDTRPAPRGGRGGGRDGGRDVQRGERPERVERSQQPRRELAAVGAAPAPAPAAAAAAAPVATPARVEEPEISGRTRRRRSAAVS